MPERNSFFTSSNGHDPHSLSPVYEEKGQFFESLTCSRAESCICKVDEGCEDAVPELAGLLDRLPNIQRLTRANGSKSRKMMLLLLVVSSMIASVSVVNALVARQPQLLLYDDDLSRITLHEEGQSRVAQGEDAQPQVMQHEDDHRRKAHYEDGMLKFVPASCPLCIDSSSAECPSFAYDSGQWIKKERAPFAITNSSDLVAAAGYKGCRGKSEKGWEWFGFAPHEFEILEEPLSYEWQEAPQCQLRKPSELQKLQALVDGPLVILGDSLQRQLFYQFSCELFEHVSWLGMPSFSKDPFDKWRLNDQFLYLSPRSPLIEHLILPPGYEFSKPLVTYIAFWLPQSAAEMWESIGEEFDGLKPPGPEYARNIDKSSNVTWNYFSNPENRIKTAVFSLGAHISTEELFAIPASPDQVLSVARWSIRSYLEGLRKIMRPDQRVLVRASPPGILPQRIPPLSEAALPPAFWNWQSMRDLSRILEDETRLLMDNRFIWIGGDRPASMRPDGRLPCVTHLSCAP